MLATTLAPAYVRAQAGAAAPAPGAQAPAPGAQPPAAPAQVTPAQQPPTVTPPTEGQGFSYDAEGRRDPFISLLRRGSDPRQSAPSSRPAGLAGLAASEITLKGTVQSRTGYVALVQGADNKTYIVRPGDTLLDGTVRTITANAMVILQQVNDPLSLEKQREVRKVLRQADEVK
jgi:Tfp pilus assembly protein PilP